MAFSWKVQGKSGWRFFLCGLIIKIEPWSNHTYYCIIDSTIFLNVRWDTTVGSIVESRLKELHPSLPVMYIKALTQDKQEARNFYECPVYKTRQRGPTYIWTFNLRSREKPTKWILAGACLILQI
jgi:hypothetical protein